MGIGYRFNVIEYVNRHASGILIIVRPEHRESLVIDGGLVVIQMLLNVKHLLTKGRQIYRRKNMTNMLMAKRLVDFLLCFKIDLVSVIKYARKPLHDGAKVFI